MYKRYPIFKAIFAQKGVSLHRKIR